LSLVAFMAGVGMILFGAIVFFFEQGDYKVM
jgi:hypothetical protein